VPLEQGIFSAVAAIRFSVRKMLSAVQLNNEGGFGRKKVGAHNDKFHNFADVMNTFPEWAK